MLATLRDRFSTPMQSIELGRTRCTLQGSGGLAQIRVFEIGQQRQGLKIEDRDRPAIHRNELILAQSTQCAIDVNRGQAERIGNEFLSQGNGKRHFIGQVNLVQSHEQFQEQVAHSLIGRSAGRIDEMLAQNSGFVGGRPE